MALDVFAEQHLGATCVQVHGTERHDDWIKVKISSSGVKFSNSFVEYWSGINEVQRASQHEGIPCDQYHCVGDVQEQFYEWKPESAASIYDSCYGMHSPQNCTSTHKGLSHENWMSNERYLDWKGKCFWIGDPVAERTRLLTRHLGPVAERIRTEDVMSHEQWLIHGLFVSSKTTLQLQPGDVISADQEITYVTQNAPVKGDKLCIVCIWSAIIALIVWVSITEYNDGTSGDASPREEWEDRNKLDDYRDR